MNLSCAEIEFLSEFEMIEIIPLESLPVFSTISGNFGPFKPPFKSLIPLWMAKSLYKKGKVSIVPPDWLNSTELSSKLEEEKSQIGFSSLPFYYLEIAKLLDSQEIKSLIQDIWEVRERKIQSGLQQLDQYYLQVNFLDLQ
jgi:GINS complex subunit 2